MEIGLLPKYQPAAVASGVGEPKPTVSGVRRDDVLYGDFYMTGESKQRHVSGYVTEVRNVKPETQPEFPMQW